MKKLLFSLLTMAFALASQAQINGSFMGLKMGFSSMEDAIDVFERHGIQYEVEDDSALSFEGHFHLEGYWATEGYMLFLNDQLALLMVATEDCGVAPESCRTIKHALKNKYQHLEDDYTNLLLMGMQEEVDDLTVWAKTDGKHSVFYAYDDEGMAWGYIISTDKLLNSVTNYIDILESLY